MRRSAIVLTAGLAFAALASGPAPGTEAPRTGGAGDAPAPPADILKAQVHGVFEMRCARCHQAVEGAAPAGDFDNVLALDEIARDPHLVQAGNPDGSRLLAYLLDGAHAIPAPGATAAPPDPAGVAAVHRWIEELPLSRGPCRGRPRLAPSAVEAAIRAWLDVFSRETARDTRFVTLTHIENECAPANELAAHRAAVDKVLNSLTWREDPVRTRSIGGTSAVLAVRLSDMGWDAARWDALSAAQPAGTIFKASPAFAEMSGARRPVIRGDWFAHAALLAPLYNVLLGVPERLRGLERRLGIEPGSGTQAVGAQGLERRETRYGPAWFAREDAASVHGARVLFALPNGFPAFAAFGPDGRRLDHGESDLGTPAARQLAPAWTGHSCFGCPAGGAAPAADAAALFRVADNLAHRSALIRAGIDPDLKSHGLEITASVARRWTSDVGFERLAAELGMAGETLIERLDALSGGDWRVARRARQGLLTRSEANALMARLEGAPGGEPDAASPPAETPDRVTLRLWSDKPAYTTGDRPVFEIETNTPCHLTLVSVNTRGFATVLLPNDFERDTLIAPGAPARMPAPSAPYDLRFAETGRETIIAICETPPDFARRIRHKFALQHFTTLGKWRDFLSGAAGATPSRSGRVRRLRHPRERAAPDVAGLPQAAPSTGRAAIVLEVRN